MEPEESLQGRKGLVYYGDEMTVRVLNPEEFSILAELPDGIVPNPNLSVAVAAFDDEGKIVGRMFLALIAHVEFPWIAPEHRGGTLLRRMEDTLTEHVATLGVKEMSALAATEEIEDYLYRSGWKKDPETVWTKEIHNGQSA